MISFNNNAVPQYNRPANNYLSWTQTQPTATYPSRNQQYVPTQNMTSTSYNQSADITRKTVNSSRSSLSNMAEIKDDLIKLKEQLKRLSDQQQVSTSQPTRESMIVKQGERIKTNLSSDGHLNPRKEFSYTEITYPLKPLPSYKNEFVKNIYQSNQLESNPTQRVVPIVNPNKRQTNTLNVTQSKVVETTNNHQEQIKNLKQKVTTLQKELEQSKTDNQIVKAENQTAKAENQTVKAENQLLKMENQNLKKELAQVKDRLKQKELQQGALNASLNSQQEQFQKQLELQRNQHLQVVQKLYAQLDQATKEVVLPTAEFDSVLKTQIQTNQQLKRQIQDKCEQIASLKDQIQDLNKVINNLRKQLQVQQLKINSDHRAQIQRLQITIAEKEGDTRNVMRSLETLDSRYRASLKELQQKDDFIMRYFVNRSSESQRYQISDLFKTYKSQFTTPATLQLFLQQQQQISQLRQKVQGT